MSEEDFGPQPPHSAEAERATLGAMLISGKAITDVMSSLTAKDFYRPAHRAIFEVIVHLAGGGAEVDAVLVAAELGRRNMLQKTGGAPYLTDLIQCVPTAVNASSYAGIVLQKATMRRLVEAGTQWQKLGYSEVATQEELDLVVAQAEEFLRDVRSPTEVGTMVGDLFDQWTTYKPKPEDIMPTPWHELTEYLGGGFRKGKLYVLAGRPGAGKSMGLLNAALELAEANLPVTLFSLEMGRMEVAERLLASGSYVSYGEIFRRKMQRETSTRVSEYIDSNRAMNFEVVDKSGITVEQIVAHIKNRKPAAVFIDYCQLITGSFKGDRREIVDHITRSLKICAADTNTCIVLASQVNRQGAERMPTLQDLRESGSIENDADVVLLLHREEGSGTVLMNVGKNRNGKMGTLEFLWRGDLMRIG